MQAGRLTVHLSFDCPELLKGMIEERMQEIAPAIEACLECGEALCFTHDAMRQSMVDDIAALAIGMMRIR